MEKRDKNSAVAKLPPSVAKHAIDFGWRAVLKRDRLLKVSLRFGVGNHGVLPWCVNPPPSPTPGTVSREAGERRGRTPRHATGVVPVFLA
jgi:hypothetical protein